MHLRADVLEAILTTRLLLTLILAPSAGIETQLVIQRSGQLEYHLLQLGQVHSLVMVVRIVAVNSTFCGIELPRPVVVIHKDLGHSIKLKKVEAGDGRHKMLKSCGPPKSRGHE